MASLFLSIASEMPPSRAATSAMTKARGSSRRSPASDRKSANGTSVKCQSTTLSLSRTMRRTSSLLRPNAVVRSAPWRLPVVDPGSGGMVRHGVVPPIDVRREQSKDEPENHAVQQMLDQRREGHWPHRVERGG